VRRIIKMWYDYVIVLIGCALIGFLIYRQVSSQWYNILLNRKMNGENIEHITRSTEIDDTIKHMIKTIIHNYESKKEEMEEEKNDEMYQ
jgi:ABC-type dipeptide/oligopeptide/nickel transport system permease component